MDRKRFSNQPCPIAQATDIFGDWWIPMILRETLYGVDTFSEFQERLDISRNILNQRLKLLVDNGILSKELYQAPNRFKYVLTQKGRSALSILAAMAAWANQWAFPEGEHPIRLLDAESGEPLVPLVIDQRSGEPMEMKEIKLALRRRFGIE